MLEGDDTRCGAFALFLRPHPGAFRQLVCPHPGEFAHFFEKNANARGLARVGGAWAPLELTDALSVYIVRETANCMGKHYTVCRKIVCISRLSTVLQRERQESGLN